MNITGFYYKTVRPVVDGYVLKERTVLLVRTDDGDYTPSGIIQLVEAGYPIVYPRD